MNTIPQVIADAKREIKVSFREAAAAYRNKPAPDSIIPAVSSAVREAADGVRNQLDKEDGLGNQTAGGMIGTGVAAVSVYKAASALPPAVAEATGAAAGTVNWNLYQAPRNAAGLTDGISAAASKALKRTDDMMTQGLGHSVTLTKHAAHTAATAGGLTFRSVKSAVPVIKTGVNTLIRTEKATVRAAAYVRKNKFAASWKKVRQKASQAFVKAGNSAVSAVINIIRSIGSQTVLPVILIAAGVMAISGGISAPVSVINGLFSGTFSAKGADGDVIYYDMRDFIRAGVPALREKYVADVTRLIEDVQTDHECVSVRVEISHTGESIDLSDIDAYFYSNSDLTNIILPIFSSVILRKYNMSPSAEEAENTLREIFEQISSPPYSIKEVIINYIPNEDGTAEKEKILVVTLEMGGLDKLLKHYFINPIERLAAKTGLSEAEKTELRNLRDYYEICLAFLDIEENDGGYTDAVDFESPYTGVMLWPAPGRYGVSDTFRGRNNPVTGKSEHHNGVDIPAPVGASIVAAESGTVIYAGYAGSYGYAVYIDHGDGVSTRYAHNSKLKVSTGQYVNQGDVIAAAGSTGNSTGSHCHFEVRINNTAVDPRPYLNY
jgi:murein DD-endopeptidase MepM/ murein hydrolase activator NlpD